MVTWHAITVKYGVAAGRGWGTFTSSFGLELADFKFRSEFRDWKEKENFERRIIESMASPNMANM